MVISAHNSPSLADRCETQPQLRRTSYGRMVRGGVTVTAAIGVFVGKSLVFSRRWTEYRTIDGHFS
jgi:hypothetical protein